MATFWRHVQLSTISLWTRFSIERKLKEEENSAENQFSIVAHKWKWEKNSTTIHSICWFFNQHFSALRFPTYKASLTRQFSLRIFSTELIVVDFPIIILSEKHIIHKINWEKTTAFKSKIVFTITNINNYIDRDNDRDNYYVNWFWRNHGCRRDWEEPKSM